MIFLAYEVKINLSNALTHLKGVLLVAIGLVFVSVFGLGEKPSRRS